MIYLISDIHERQEFAGLNEYCKISGDEDLLIVLGDVGLGFKDDYENDKFTKFFLSIDKNIAILDGNHDNFAYLDSFPRENWNGGIVSRLSDKIVHLRRGNVYSIESMSFFVFGGCKSSPKWKEMGLWHDGEEPLEEEISFAHENLKKCSYKVDYILTHKYESSDNLGTVSPVLQKLTSAIEEKVEYKHWYAGHWHKNASLDSKHTFVFDKLITLKK